MQAAFETTQPVKPTPRTIQFSIKSLMIVTTVFAVIVGLCMFPPAAAIALVAFYTAVVTACIVASVPLVIFAEIVLMAVKIVLSTALPGYKNVPIMHWRKNISSGDSGWPLSLVFAVCFVAPYWGCTHGCGACCACLGGLCWNWCNAAL